MNKYLNITLLLFTLLFLFGNPQASAHELLPKEVIEYIKAHPNASAHEIELFTKNISPDVAAKYANNEQLLQSAKNQALPFLDNTLNFIELGVLHILGGPDHVLFVLSLLLAFVSIRQTMGMVSAFTLAHSVSLILAGTNILTLAPGIIEPIIAFSIAYVAFATVFLKNTRLNFLAKNSIPIIFFFGLFHGLGFASLLHEIEIPANRFISSLLFFNVGIELGQIFILSLALPLVYFLYHKGIYHKLIKIPASIIIAMGITWGIQRLI